MNNHERYDFHKKNGLITLQTEEDRIKLLVNKLIDLLFKPNFGEGEFIPDWERITSMGIDSEEPVNWGDLKCNEVKKFDDGNYLVVIDEASPGDCQTFCEYIERYMESWGWIIKVETEW